MNIEKEVIKFLQDFLNQTKTWNELHKWTINNLDSLESINAYHDLLDDFETIFLSDENDDPQFLIEKNDIEYLLLKFKKREADIEKFGEESIIKKIQHINEQAELERKNKYIKRHNKNR